MIMSKVTLAYTYNLRKGQFVMGTNRPGWQVIDHLESLPSGRVDIHTADGRVIPNQHTHTLWRTT